jgi:hypothetical protein
MIDREQAIAVFQDAVDHADWSGRESVLEAGIDAVLALEAPDPRIRKAREVILRTAWTHPQARQMGEEVLRAIADGE